LAGGGAHLRLLVGDGAQTAEAIGFRFGDYAELLAFTQAQIDLACTIQTHQWGGAESIQLVVVGLATPGVDLGAIATDTGAVLARLFARADDYLDGHLVEVEQAPAFHTKVVGVTFDGRQAILPAVRPGEFLQLIRDPGNPVDPHAIKVCLADGRQLGFLRAALSARLAPAIDAGARYSATAASVTGGGDRAHGLNIYVVREASWSAEASERAAPWVRHPSGPGFADWLSVRLYRGRALSAPQRDVIGALLSGERVVGRFGPGRGLAGIAAMGAAALTARGDGPVMIVLPRVADVEAWRGLMDAWCRDIGLRAGMLHGAMAARDTAWSSSAWERGEVDVLLASTSWAVEHAPASRAVVVALDGLSFGEDLAALLDRYGERVRLVLGTAPLDHLERAAVRLRMGRVVTDPTPRVNLRVVDRRGRPDSEITLTTGLRPERTLVVAADARAGVAAARELRARHPGMADRIAYYHDGLPGTLRRVLEDLFAAGQITTLVTGTHLVDPSLPVDVARVIAIGLPTDRLLAADLLGAGGLGGRTAVVELGFGAEALEAIQAAVETRFPTREMLARCYHRLRERFHGGSWTSTGGVPAGVEDQALSAAAIGSCLDVFVEAGVLTREGGDDSGIGYALIDPNDRVDLDRSLRYREGVRARTAWKDLREWATGPVAAILADLARS
jgi:single-stranded-DNA-specific exonuclease